MTLSLIRHDNTHLLAGAMFNRICDLNPLDCRDATAQSELEHLDCVKTDAASHHGMQSRCLSELSVVDVCL